MASLPLVLPPLLIPSLRPDYSLGQLSSHPGPKRKDCMPPTVHLLDENEHVSLAPEDSQGRATACLPAHHPQPSSGEQPTGLSLMPQTCPVLAPATSSSRKGSLSELLSTFPEPSQPASLLSPFPHSSVPSFLYSTCLRVVSLCDGCSPSSLHIRPPSLSCTQCPRS